MRELSGIRQPRLVDALVVPVLRMTFLVLHLSKRAELLVLGMISPGTVPVAAPVLLKVPPTHPEVVTPAEARERYGYDKPAEAHLEWRARQHDKVFGKGEAPSNDGLLESQPILGRL